MKNKNNKTIKWIIGILAVPLIILAIHFHFYFFLKDSYHADESVNKNATANFLYATAISVSWINILHFKMGVQYDSTLMKPFTSLRDYYFNKGQKLVKKDNAEDAHWWITNYGRVYGFGVGDKNNNMSINKLNKQIKRELTDKIHYYIVKLGTYEIKGVHSDEYINILKNMGGYVAGYLLGIDDIHDGKTVADRTRNFYLDKDMTKKLKDIYLHFNQIVSNTSIPKYNMYKYSYIKYRVLQFIIFGTMMQNSTVSTHMCNTNYVKDYIELFDELSEWANDSSIKKDEDAINKTNLFKSIALSNHPNKISTHVLTFVDENCPKYTQTQRLLKLKFGDKNNEL